MEIEIVIDNSYWEFPQTYDLYWFGLQALEIDVIATGSETFTVWKNGSNKFQFSVLKFQNEKTIDAVF